LEGKMVKKGGLHSRKLALPGNTLDGANRLASEEVHAGDAGVDRPRRSVRIVKYDDACAARADAATKLGAGQVEIFAEVIPVAPAILNAIADAIGKRFDSLP
jgi:hypothetical protein